MWPLLQFYSVRTRYEMDDILDVKNACNSVHSLIPLDQWHETILLDAGMPQARPMMLLASV